MLSPVRPGVPTRRAELIRNRPRRPGLQGMLSHRIVASLAGGRRRQDRLFAPLRATGRPPGEPPRVSREAFKPGRGSADTAHPQHKISRAFPAQMRQCCRSSSQISFLFCGVHGRTGSRPPPPLRTQVRSEVSGVRAESSASRNRYSGRRGPRKWAIRTPISLTAARPRHSAASRQARPRGTRTCETLRAPLRGPARRERRGGPAAGSIPATHHQAYTRARSAAPPVPRPRMPPDAGEGAGGRQQAAPGPPCQESPGRVRQPAAPPGGDIASAEGRQELVREAFVTTRPAIHRRRESTGGLVSTLTLQQDGLHAIGSLQGNGPEGTGRPSPGLGIRSASSCGELAVSSRSSPTSATRPRMSSMASRIRRVSASLRLGRGCTPRKEGPGNSRRSPMRDSMQRTERVRQPRNSRPSRVAEPRPCSRASLVRIASPTRSGTTSIAAPSATSPRCRSPRWSPYIPAPITPALAPRPQVAPGSSTPERLASVPTGRAGRSASRRPARRLGEHCDSPLAGRTVTSDCLRGSGDRRQATPGRRSCG